MIISATSIFNNLHYDHGCCYSVTIVINDITAIIVILVLLLTVIIPTI